MTLMYLIDINLLLLIFLMLLREQPQMSCLIHLPIDSRLLDYVDYDDVSPSIWSAEGLISEVYPSEETHEGYVVFLVPKDAKELVICFSPLYSETGASYYKYDFDSRTTTVKSENFSKETASTKSSEASKSDTSSTSESTVSDRFKIV